ncbi:MAG TPA: hypothetical protein VGM54_10255 [Chthoniobacter sp.]|jgi:hypothetical protein
MNRIAACLLIAASAYIITACANTQKGHHHLTTAACGSPTDYFRLNMRQGYGPLTPPSPSPIGGAKMWVDVANWQCFLDVSLYKATNPPNDSFGILDTQATKAFQTWAHTQGYTVPYPPNGIVDQNTYNAAVKAGMPAYTPVPTTALHAHHHHHGTSPTPTATPAKGS